MSTRNILVKASHALCSVRDVPLRLSCSRCAHIQNATRILASTSVNSRLFCRRVTSTASSGAASLAEQFKQASGEAQAQRKENIRTIFRTLETDPLQHTLNHESLYYTLALDEVATRLPTGFSQDFLRLAETFQEVCIMVRRPSIEILDFIRHRNPDHPAVRLVMYGRAGTGKSLIMAHTIHYAARAGFLIVHVDWPINWIWRHWQSIIPSTFREGRYDQPISATNWLTAFKLQNAEVLQNLKTTSRYEWGKREVTEENQPLLDVVDWGLNRGIYATDCIGVLVKEIKKQTSEKRIKTLVAIDGLNAFWGITKHTDDQREPIPVGSISLIHHMKKLLMSDWTNAMVVTAVDPNAADPDQRHDWTPKQLLTTEGFELMDPFIPIYVDDYIMKEVESCLDYYEDRKWIQNAQGLTREGRDELIFKSCRNPHNLMRMAAPL